MEYLNEGKWSFDEKTGIWSTIDMTMDTAFSDEMQDHLLNLEDSSWWFSYRANIIVGQMDKFFSKEKLSLDIGGGNGFTSCFAKERGYHIGLIEPTLQACRNARRRGIKEVNCGAVTDDSILDDSIEQGLLLDVLEHIEDDKSFVALLNRKMIRGGYLILTVPAFMCLWSSEDDAAGHFRRYRVADICNLLRTQGFDVCYRSYFMRFLFFPILFIRVGLEKAGILKPQREMSEEERKRIHKAQFKQRGGIVKALLSFLEWVEMHIMRKDNLVPYGSSIIVVARKV